MKTTFKNFKLSSSYACEKSSPWGADAERHNRITIINTDNGKKTSFDFWESANNPEIKTEKALLGAFECFLSDATSGDYARLCDFAKDFGYDWEHFEEAQRAYKGCKNALNKFLKLTGYSMDMLYDLYNQVIEAE